MKKVGILTFHYADNYGAVLQAYALREKINSLNGCFAEIINYIPARYKCALYNNDEECRRNLLKKRDCFEYFLKTYCLISTNRVQAIEEQDYDYFCVGSDQVWNLNYVGEEYFLTNLSDSKVKFSYAASIGMSSEKLVGYKGLYKEYLEGFREISLREDEQVEFLSRECGVNCEVVLDPTLLLKAEDYETLVPGKRLVKAPFVFFFWIHHDHEFLGGVEFVNTISRKYQLEVVHNEINSRPYLFAKESHCMIYEGPEQFLWYIKNAAYVVTNSYHVTLFAMQFKKPFYVFAVESMRSRIDMLAYTYGISDRVVNKYMSPNEINSEIDYESIHRKIQIEREKSVAFLRRVLDIESGE